MYVNGNTLINCCCCICVKKTDKNLTGCDDSNLCESRKRDVRILLYLWLFFFDFVKFTEIIGLPVIECFETLDRQSS